jgi:hypothetical protein
MDTKVNADHDKSAFKMIRIVPDSETRVWSKKFVPIRDWQSYVNLQKLAGASQEELDYYESAHKREYPKDPEPQPKKTYNTNTVIVKLKISDDKVKLLAVENKLATMIREYSSHGRHPPRKVWIEAWIQAGRDFKDVLAGIVKMESRRNERCELLEKANEQPVKKKALKPVMKLS